MTSIPRQKRMAPEPSAGINGLIAACNKNDRFQLLENDRVLPGNLDNPVHPVFSRLGCDGPMKQMLQLASHFLFHDTLLTFFVPLLYGRELTGVVGGKCKTYLSDPVANASAEKHQRYLSSVRDALNCLSHSLSFYFRPPAKRVYARTLLDDERPTHNSTCCPAFQRKHSCTIELSDHFQNYYKSGEYAAASRCAQFRHDFLFATTLVHEIVHAVGVLRRGNLNEPHIRADCPETEWGYGWEHFMFGCVINPQDKTVSGTHLLMRKAWGDAKLAEIAGGKEYSDVSMSYIAQWFREETWDLVNKQGPTAIAAPIAHFKIQSSNKLGAWVVVSDHPEVRKDLVYLNLQWQWQAMKPNPVSRSPKLSHIRRRASKILWKCVTTKQLQKDNVSIPARTSQRFRYCPSCYQHSSESRPICCKPQRTILTCEQKNTIIQGSLCSSDTASRKRHGDPPEYSKAKKVKIQ